MVIEAVTTVNVSTTTTITTDVDRRFDTLVGGYVFTISLSRDSVENVSSTFFLTLTTSYRSSRTMRGSFTER